MGLYQSKLSVLHAAYRIDRGEDFASEVSMAKHFVANSLKRTIEAFSKSGSVAPACGDLPLRGAPSRRRLVPRGAPRQREPVRRRRRHTCYSPPPWRR